MGISGFRRMFDGTVLHCSSQILIIEAFPSSGPRLPQLSLLDNG
jgi:hypothetical protein